MSTLPRPERDPDWPGGHYLAHVLDVTAVRPGYGCVWLTLIGSISGKRVSCEMSPGETLALIERLRSAARLALAAENLAPGDERSRIPGQSVTEPAPSSDRIQGNIA